MKKGKVFWITGLSDAGKTTIGKLLYDYLGKKQDNLVWLDGDVVRKIYQNTDYSEDGRKRVSYMNMRLCKMLAEQGIDVIITVIGMKNEYRDWNRKNIENYFEIYLEVPIEVLIKRDSKGIYAKALSGQTHNVYGIDLAFEEPKTPDIKIINDGTESPQEVCNHIIRQLGL